MEKHIHLQIFNYFYSFVTKSDVPLHKLVYITTDEAKSMTCQVIGIIALCRQHDNFPDFLYYHSHQSPASFGT
jgi:hypothetical protein